MHQVAKQELGEIYVPKQKLGNEGKAGCAALSRYGLEDLLRQSLKSLAK